MHVFIYKKRLCFWTFRCPTLTTSLCLPTTLVERLPSCRSGEPRMEVCINSKKLEAIEGCAFSQQDDTSINNREQAGYVFSL